jgi:hypothetical protein
MDVQLPGRRGHIAVRVEIGQQGIGVGRAVPGVVGADRRPASLSHTRHIGQRLGHLNERRAGPDVFDRRHQRLVRYAGPSSQHTQDQVGILT